MCEIYDFNTREMDDRVALFLWDVPILIAQNREDLSKLMEEKLDGILSEISPATPVRLIYDGPSELFKAVEGDLVERGFFPYKRSRITLSISIKRIGEFMKFGLSMGEKMRAESLWVSEYSRWEKDFCEFLDENLHTTPRKLRKMALFSFKGIDVICDGVKIEDGEVMWTEEGKISCEISTDGKHWFKKDLVLHLPAEFIRFEVHELDVKGEPEGAIVRIDGEEYGRAPLKLKLLDGIHTVEVEKDGYEKISRTLYIGSNSEFEYSLKRLENAKVKFSFNLPADVVVDGIRVVEKAEKTELELEPGEHRIKIEAPRRRKEEFTLNLREGEKREINIVLKGIPGKIDWIFDLPEEGMNYLPISPDVLALYDSKKLVVMNIRKKELIGKVDLPSGALRISSDSKHLIVMLKNRLILLNMKDPNEKAHVDFNGIPVSYHDGILTVSDGRLFRLNQRLGKILWTKKMNPILQMRKLDGMIFTLDVFGGLCRLDLRTMSLKCERFPGFFKFSIFDGFLYIISSHEILKMDIGSFDILERWRSRYRIEEVYPCGDSIFISTPGRLVEISEDGVVGHGNRRISRGEDDIFLIGDGRITLRSCQDGETMDFESEYDPVDVKEAFDSFYVRTKDGRIIKFFGMNGL
ncbi:MAG TPA: PEGA domain-containing protein [Thermotogales bacterium]|nr:PEGA domain-containing protein [Thermotogales bacterium]